MRVALFLWSFLAIVPFAGAQISNIFNENVANVRLESLQGDTLTLAQVIESKDDSLVLIDFWASWCKPCIQEIPHALALKNEMKAEKIIFIFISTDEGQPEWLNAMKYHQSNPSPQYRLLKEDKVIIRDYFNISGIPYYLLIDLKNNQFVKDTPWPSNPRLAKMIRKWL